MKRSDKMERDISIKMDENMLNVRVIFLVENKGRYLLETSSVKDIYNVLGGRMKFFESSSVAVLREIKEELGISLSENEIKLIATIENFFKFENCQFHEFSFAFYVNLNDDYSICKQDKFANLDKPEQSFFWVKKEELHKYKILSPFFYDLDPKTYKHIIVDNR
jgi:8-oxo-dGTP pyrophosphatase MutT (NUDIX family)